MAARTRHATEAAYAAQGPVIVAESRRRARTPIPGLLVVRLAVHGDDRGWFKENWQREKMTGARPARLRAGAEQHLVQRAPRHHPRHPRRAVGQAGLGRHRPGLRRLGRPARGRDVRHRRSPSSSSPATAVFVPRGVGNGYQTLEPTTRPTPTWSTTTGARTSTYPARQPRRRDRGHRLADPARAGRALREGPRHPRLADVDADAAAKTAGARRRRPARPGPAAAFPRRRRASTRDELDLTDADAVAALALARATTSSSTPRPTPPWTPPRRPRAGATPGPSTPTAAAALARLAARARLHAGALSSDYVFDGTRDEHDEDEPLVAAGRLRPDQGRRRRSPSRPRPGTTSLRTRG